MSSESTHRRLTPLEATVGELLAAADRLVNSDLVMPGLILFYSLIDSLAWLSLPDGAEDVNGADFVAWVRTYGLETRIAPCTAEDLYGARCGLLHSYSPDSRRSRKGEVRPIYYILGWEGRELLQKEIDRRGDPGVALHIADLRDGLVAAIDAFRMRLLSDAELRSRVERRSGNLFHSMIPEPYASLVKAALGQARPQSRSSEDDPAAV